MDSPIDFSNSEEGTVIDETLMPMDVSQRDIFRFSMDFVRRPNPTQHLQADRSSDETFDLDISGISNIPTEAELKQEQIENLQQEIVGLKEKQQDLLGEVETLTQKVEELVLETRVDAVEKAYLQSENAKLQAKCARLEEVILNKNRRIGAQGRELNKFKLGMFTTSAAGDAVGYGSMLNGVDTFWVKGSQMEWDESFHRPLFGYEEDDVTNFVMVQKTNAGEGRIVVNAVGCQVIPDTLLEFRLNGREVSHFGF